MMEEKLKNYMNNEILLSDDQLYEWLQVCRTLQSLKELTRQGSTASGLGRGDADSVASHISLVGIMSLILTWELKTVNKIDVNPEYVATMALLHDIGASILGDVNSEVKRRYFSKYRDGEKLAFEDLVGGLQSAEKLVSYFEEFAGYSTTSSKLARFVDGLESWLEVLPKSSITWMQQHIDYRDRIFTQLKEDKHFGNALSEMFHVACHLVEQEQIVPKRPIPSLSDKDKKLQIEQMDNHPLDAEHLVEWLQIFVTVERLKRLTRQGFITSGGFNRWDTDSIADHVGLVALISLTLAFEIKETTNLEINPLHVVALALIHDLGEAVIGDVNSETKRRYFSDYGKSEKSAVEDLLGQLQSREKLIDLFLEFEACKTTEAKIVRFADSLDAWMRVLSRSSDTWMPQHIEYRNRTFSKLKNDPVFGDLLSELFLRACLTLQGQPLAPKRFVGQVEAITDFSSGIASDIAHLLRELRDRRQIVKDDIENSSSQKRGVLENEEDAIRSALANADLTLLELRERLSSIEEETRGEKSIE